jgi:DNA-binding beta-propeller fold protein YncE
MRIALVCLAATLTLGPVRVMTSANHGLQPVNDRPNPYLTIDNHFKLAEGRWWESASGIDVDVDGSSIWVADRCAADRCSDSRLNPILKFDQAGNLVKRFGEKMFNVPHGIHVDRGGNVWVTDVKGPDETIPGSNGKGRAVYKFSPDGRLLLTLGTPGVAGGATSSLLNEPSDVVTAPNGDIFVADGHANENQSAAAVARIVKFTKDGRFLTCWGRPGQRPGEFSNPHGLAIDSRGRLFVADRGNNRIQIFDQDGTFLAEWRQFGRVSGIFIAADDTLYAADSDSSDETNPGWRRGIRIGSARDGSVKYFIPDPSPEPGNGGAEGVVADTLQNVYSAAVGGGALALKKYIRQ